MASSLIKILYFVLGFHLAALTQANFPTAQADTSAYEEWVRPYKQGSLSAIKSPPSQTGKQEGNAFLVMTVFDEAEAPTTRPINETLVQLRQLQAGNRYQSWGVFTTGQVSFRRWTGSAIQSGEDSLTDSALSVLENFAAKLPGDGSRLPPNGRRLLVQSASADRTDVRVYDLANLPDEVSDAIALSRANIHPWKLRLEPEKRLPPDQYPGQTSVHRTVSPDDSIAVVQGQFEVGIMDTASSKIVRELREPEVGRRMTRLSNPCFTPDGHYLLLRSSLPALRIFDTKTWDPITSLPFLPAGAIAFFPSKDWTRAVYGSDGGDIGLWDVTQKRLIAKLASGSEISDVQFSPDGSLIAVAFRPKGQSRLVSLSMQVGIWKMHGTHLSALHRSEQIHAPVESIYSGDDTGTLLWSHDGAHLFTISGIAGEYQIALWNVSTGRSTTALSGCNSEIHRFMSKDGFVVVDCYQTAVLLWSEDTILKEAVKFEDSLRKSH
jgi:hypothetical protein